MDYDIDFVGFSFESSKGRMHYMHHRGPGKTLLFIHGFAASTRSWKRLVSYLDNQLDVYLIDLLGHGISDAPDVDYSVAMHLATIKEFIDYTKINPVLFGHSYGGWISALCAEHYPDTKGLILEDSAGLAEFSNEMEKQIPKYKSEMIRQATMLNPRSHVVQKSVEAEESAEHLTKESLSKVKARSLIIWGENDDVIWPRYAEMFKNYLPGSALEVIKGAKHVPHYTHAAEVGRITNGFVQSL